MLRPDGPGKTSAVIELYAGLNRGTLLIASTCLGHVTTGLPFISIIQCLTPGLMCGLAWFRLASARRKGLISVKAVVLKVVLAIASEVIGFAGCTDGT